MILDHAGTSREICDSKRVRSFFWGELGGSAVSGLGGFLCSGVSLEQLERFSLNSRTPRMRSSAGCPGVCFLSGMDPFLRVSGSFVQPIALRKTRGSSVRRIQRGRTRRRVSEQMDPVQNSIARHDASPCSTDPFFLPR